VVALACCDCLHIPVELGLEALLPHSKPHAVFSAFHPELLAGLALVGVPILIHLLLRKRPQPRPWAAMRWLLAAAKAAQRRWRLTNLLLLLMRCLIIALAVLAVARPRLDGFGGGERLVVVIDRTASMGARGADPGPLASAKSQLSHLRLSYRSIAVVTVDAHAELIADGPAAAALAAISTLDASELPGGLDAGSRPENAERIIGACRRGSDVLLISDFSQDDGASLIALLKPVSRTISRWRVGAPVDNASIVNLEGLGDQLPDSAGEITVQVAGAAADVSLAVDDAPFIPAGRVSASSSIQSLRVAVPPLAEGTHRLRVQITDGSLDYDNHLTVPVTIRPRIEALAVADAPDYVIAALHADDGRSFSFREANAGQFAAEVLPLRGVVVLRNRIVNPQRLADWVKEGGVLWADATVLLNDSVLKGLTDGLELLPTKVPGGAYATGQKDIDEVLGIASIHDISQAKLPGSAEILLRAGRDPAVVAIPAGNGWLVVELCALSSDRELQARGTTPLWVVREARRLASRLDAPKLWMAGEPTPQTVTLKRGGEVANVVSGEALMLAPGTWDGASSPVVVLPSRDEGKIDRLGGADAPVTLEKALPHGSGADLGPWMALALLLMMILEGAFAAWAGKTYGR
jgi:hypothetical protein